MTGPEQRRAHHLKNLPAYTAYLTGAIPDQFWESMAFLFFLPFMLMADELTLVWNDIRMLRSAGRTFTRIRGEWRTGFEK